MTSVGAHALAVCAAALAACSTPQAPSVVPKEATVTRVDGAGIAMTVVLDVNNPNGFDVTAERATAHVVVSSRYDLGTTTWTTSVRLAAGKTTPVNWPVAVAWRDVLAMSSLAAESDNVPYAVDGTLTFGGNLASVHIPYRMSGSITHQQFLDAALRSLPSLGGPTP